MRATFGRTEEGHIQLDREHEHESPVRCYRGRCKMLRQSTSSQPVNAHALVLPAIAKKSRPLDPNRDLAWWLVLVGGGRHDGNLAKTCHFALLAMQCGALLVLRVAMHSLLGLFISDHGQDWQEERVKFRSTSNRENVAVTCMSTPTIERSRSMRCLSNHFRPVNNVL